MEGRTAVYKWRGPLTFPFSTPCGRPDNPLLPQSAGSGALGRIKDLFFGIILYYILLTCFVGVIYKAIFFAYLFRRVQSTGFCMSAGSGVLKGCAEF